jgi:hypothetical protein
VVWWPRVRPLVMALPAVLVFAAGCYVALAQYRYGYPPVFEWPTLFPRARLLAWLAVMLLAGDVIVEIVRGRFVKQWPRGDGPDRGSDVRD